MSLNKVMLIGNVGKDPEVRYLGGSDPNAKVATFSLATTERYRDRNSGEMRENTEWHNIVAWRNNADVAEKYIRKGTQLYIEGKIRTRSWDDQSGNKRYTTEILADSLQLLGRKADNPAVTEGNDTQPRTYAQSSYERVAQRPAYAPSQSTPVQSTPVHSAPVAVPPTPAVPSSSEEDDDDLPF